MTNNPTVTQAEPPKYAIGIWRAANDATGSFLRWQAKPERAAATVIQRELEAAEASGYARAIDDAVEMLRNEAQLCDCHAHSSGECGCGAWDTEPGERSYKRAYVEDMADDIEALCPHPADVVKDRTND